MTIQKIAAKGQTIVLVEQNAMMAMDVAGYCYVLVTGTIEYEGIPEQLKQNN